MGKIFCLICSVFVFIQHCYSFLQLIHEDNYASNIQSQVNNSVSPEIELLALALKMLRNEALERQRSKNKSVGFKYQEDSDSNRSTIYNDGIFGKYAGTQKSNKLSVENLQNDLNDDFDEDEDEDLGFSEKERHDGFKKTPPSEYPYAILLLALTEDREDKICSGSLVTSSWVLTAAHCIDGYIEYVIVYAGGSSAQELIEYSETRSLRPSAQIRISYKFYKHPSYNEDDQLRFDVGVVRVKKFKMTSTVNTVRLYQGRWGDTRYKPCVLTGFGRVFFDEKDPDDNTRKSNYLKVRRGCPCDSQRVIMDNMMCSKPMQDYGLCSGDSGAGLVCRGRLVAVAKAILTVEDLATCDLKKAKHYLCGVKNTLSFFQDINPYLGWIESKINNTRTVSCSCSLVAAGVIVLLIMWQ